VICSQWNESCLSNINKIPQSALRAKISCAEQIPAPVQWPSIFETAKAAAKPEQWIWPARKGKMRKQGYQGPTPGPILGDYWDDWTQQWVTDRKLQVLMPPIAEHPEF